MASLTSLIYPVCSLLDLVVKSEWLTRKLGNVYEFFSLLYQSYWHVKRIIAERSSDSVVSARDWVHENSSKLNRYSFLILLVVLGVLLYLLVSLIMSG